MKTFVVQSLPLKEVIQSLAEQMNSDYSEQCGEYQVDIPSDVGVGKITGINFETGMGIIQYDCHFKEDVEIQFIVNDIHPLKFLFVIEGSLIHRFENEDIEHKLEKYQNVIVASSQTNGHILQFKKNETIKVNSLEISRAEFSDKIGCELDTLSEHTVKLFSDIKAEKKFYYEGYYSIHLSDVFEEIRRFDQKDFLKKMFLEGKSYLILTRQIMQYEDDLQDFSSRTVLRRSEIKLIREAAVYIDKEIETLTSIKELGLKFGLNSNKLQNGFNTLFKVSVNQYIQNRRLKMAKEFIENTDKNMSEITNAIGLNSRSYFSKIFKERYGISPSDLKRKNSELAQERNSEIE